VTTKQRSPSNAKQPPSGDAKQHQATRKGRPQEVPVGSSTCTFQQSRLTAHPSPTGCAKRQQWWQ
jgi:hypothetical protein